MKIQKAFNIMLILLYLILCQYLFSQSKYQCVG